MNQTQFNTKNNIFNNFLTEHHISKKIKNIKTIERMGIVMGSIITLTAIAVSMQSILSRNQEFDKFLYNQIITIVFIFFLIIINGWEKDYKTLSAIELKNLKNRIKGNENIYEQSIDLYRKQKFITYYQQRKILEIYEFEKKQNEIKQAEQEMQECLKP